MFLINKEGPHPIGHAVRTISTQENENLFKNLNILNSQKIPHE